MESLDKDLVQFRGCVDSIGTNFDNHDNRKELKRLRSQIKKKITSAEVNLQGQKGRCVCLSVCLSVCVQVITGTKGEVCVCLSVCLSDCSD